MAKTNEPKIPEGVNKAGNEGPDNTTFREATGDSAFVGDAPGSSVKTDDVYFEGLGNLMDFPEEAPVEDPEGHGEWCVVLADYHSGANGVAYVKGDVKRISKLVNGYDNDDLTRANVRRLLQVGAIRQATSDERGKSRVEVTAATESVEVKIERAKRQKAEQELEDLKRQMGQSIEKAPEQNLNKQTEPVRTTPAESDDPDWEA